MQPRSLFDGVGLHGAGLPGASAEQAYSVLALTRAIKARLETQFPDVWVAGEASRVTQATSGHIYFTLKDDQAQMAATIWNTTVRRTTFHIVQGESYLVRGKVQVYEPRGQYQLIVQSIRPLGAGALQLKLEDLKRRLAAEGLFDTARKRPLPFLPRRIGLVTSPTGAAVHDFLRTVIERWPSAQVLLSPARVQGLGAAEELAAALHRIYALDDIEVIVIGRGGGSIEDLWAFNEEVLVRAVAASPVPIVSAVGHEIDTAITDLAADVRALTPTHAGTLVVPDAQELTERLDEWMERLAYAVQRLLRRRRERLAELAARPCLRDPAWRLRQAQQQLDEDVRRLLRAGPAALRGPRQRLALTGGPPRLLASARRQAEVRRRHWKALGQELQQLSPLGVLQRGYSFTHRPGELRPLRHAASLRPDELVVTLLAQGRLTARVVSTEEQDELRMPDHV